jgi:outer membrane protein TolC
MRKPGFAVDSSATYTLADLVALAEAHHPETRAAWEQARAKAAELGVARAELYPTLAAAALSQTAREETYLNTHYYRQTLQSFDLAIDLNYTICDFGARAGRIDATKARLLAADFVFNDVHRRLIRACRTSEPRSHSLSTWSKWRGSNSRPRLR